MYQPAASMYTSAPVTTVAAAPVTTSAPVTTTLAAPTVVTTQSASYVAAPVVQQSAVVETVAAPVPVFAGPEPVKLTTGLVDPAKLEAEKVAYGQALEKQLKKQSDAVMEEASIKKKMLEKQAEMQRAQADLQITEQLKMAVLQV